MNVARFHLHLNKKGLGALYKIVIANHSSSEYSISSNEERLVISFNSFKYETSSAVQRLKMVAK